MRFITVDTYEKMSRLAANIMGGQISLKPDSVIGLATGSTPLGLYRELVRRCGEGELDFSQVTTINLDEYAGLDSSHEQSYRYFMNHNLLDHINIPKENTFVPEGNATDLAEACRVYDERIKACGGIDMQLLGIGHDGHIGFNEPGPVFVKETNVVDLTEMTIKANARFFDDENQVPRQAVTMGIGAIMNAKKILMVVNGQEKKEILKKAFFGPITPEVPASILQLHPDVTVIYSEE